MQLQNDWDELARFAREQGVRIGAVNPNLFQEDEYRLGSFCHPDAGVRRRALEHCLVTLSDFAGAHEDAIREVDLNPVIVAPRGQGVCVVDATIVLR